MVANESLLALDDMCFLPHLRGHDTESAIYLFWILLYSTRPREDVLTVV